MLSSEHRQLLTGHFAQYISDHKKEFITRVLDQRTRHITMVMENIYQSQNASTVVRTCECMGLQDVHIIEDQSKYQVNSKVLKGSNKWLDLIRYKAKNINNSEACFQALREKGYKIVVTDPSPDCVSIDAVSVDEKIAIVMGNELKGISSYAQEHCDLRVKIPMYGFTESMNISVSAAICMNTLMPKLRNSSVNWHLSDEEKKDIRLQWFRKVVRKSDIIEREFLTRLGAFSNAHEPNS
jgi:tRNA (guanosine-2'-O-)-methyltransferase